MNFRIAVVGAGAIDNPEIIRAREGFWSRIP
jgi:hypothetical protein